MNITVPYHLKDRFDALTALPIGLPPEPWRKVSSLAVGGLTEIGFADSSDILLIVSSAGRGVLDCISGELVARDPDVNFDHDIGNLLIDGIGPLAGRKVRVAGLNGGGLALSSTDGWSVEKSPLAWPDEEIFLFADFHTMFWSPRGTIFQATRLGGALVSPLRAFGFSPTGRSLVLATSSDLTVFTR